MEKELEDYLIEKYNCKYLLTTINRHYQTDSLIYRNDEFIFEMTLVNSELMVLITSLKYKERFLGVTEFYSLCSCGSIPISYSLNIKKEILDRLVKTLCNHIYDLRKNHRGFKFLHGSKKLV